MSHFGSLLLGVQGGEGIYLHQITFLYTSPHWPYHAGHPESGGQMSHRHQQHPSPASAWGREEEERERNVNRLQEQLLRVPSVLLLLFLCLSPAALVQFTPSLPAVVGMDTVCPTQPCAQHRTTQRHCLHLFFCLECSSQSTALPHHADAKKLSCYARCRWPNQPNSRAVDLLLAPGTCHTWALWVLKAESPELPSCFFSRGVGMWAASSWRCRRHAKIPPLRLLGPCLQLTLLLLGINWVNVRDLRLQQWSGHC